MKNSSIKALYAAVVLAGVMSMAFGASVRQGAADYNKYAQSSPRPAVPSDGGNGFGVANYVSESKKMEESNNLGETTVAIDKPSIIDKIKGIFSSQSAIENVMREREYYDHKIGDIEHDRSTSSREGQLSKYSAVYQAKQENKLSKTREKFANLIKPGSASQSLLSKMGRGFQNLGTRATTLFAGENARNEAHTKIENRKKADAAAEHERYQAKVVALTEYIKIKYGGMVDQIKLQTALENAGQEIKQITQNNGKENNGISFSRGISTQTKLLTDLGISDADAEQYIRNLLKMKDALLRTSAENLQNVEDYKREVEPFYKSGTIARGKEAIQDAMQRVKDWFTYTSQQRTTNDFLAKHFTKQQKVALKIDELRGNKNKKDRDRRIDDVIGVNRLVLFQSHGAPSSEMKAFFHKELLKDLLEEEAKTGKQNEGPRSQPI